MGRSNLLWDGKKHRRQSVAIVRGSDAKRTGLVGAKEPRHSLEDQGCLGMVLTKVSDTWGIGSESWRALASRNPLAVESGLLTRRDVLMQWKVGEKKNSRRPKPSAETRITTRGLLQIRPSSKPSAASAIALDPCRGWGRNPSAHIRAQREPVVSPAGTGVEYRSPRRVSWQLVPLR